MIFSKPKNDSLVDSIELYRMRSARNSRALPDDVLFARMKNVILAESPTLQLFKAIERGNLDGVKQALDRGALVSPGGDKNALNARINNMVRYGKDCR